MLLGPVPSAAEGATAIGVVESLHAVLISAMKEADSLGYQGRFDRLSPVLSSSFDLGFMAAKCVGRVWKTLNEKDQQRWLDAFERHTTSNYAGRFNNYSGQVFETLGEQPAAHDTVLVRTKLVNPSDQDVQLNYRLRSIDGGWRIIDVYLNGTVSELALRRSEYSSVLKRDGFEVLLASVDRKAEDLAKGVIE